MLMGIQAIDFDPSDATLLSNRSLCWIRLGQAEHALTDAKACRALRPDWPKACYREGAALRLVQASFHSCKRGHNITFEKIKKLFVLYDVFSHPCYCRSLRRQPALFMRV